MVATLERGVDEPRPPATRAPRPDLLEALLAVGAALLLVAFSTATYAVFWAPKAALLLPAVVPGTVALARLARGRVPGARWAVVFLAVAGVATMASDRPVLSLLGLHGWGTGWLFLVASLGLWALGSTLGERGAGYVERGLLIGALATAAFAWLQSTVTLPVDVLVPTGGRATSFLGNSVHLGAVAGGGLALVGARLRHAERSGWWLVAAFGLAGALELSGSRAALVPAALLVVWLGWRMRGRRAAVFAATVVAGLLVAGATPQASGTGGGATERAAVSLDPGASSGRTAVWRASVEAIEDRPVVGWGPARGRAALSPRVSSELARNEVRGTEYTDAHNLLLEVGVTTGLLGLACFGAWLLAAARRARGPLAVFACFGAVVGLAQPLSIAVTPLLALALGASRRREGVVPTAFGRGLGRKVAAAGAVAALGAGGVFLAGEVALGGAALDFSAADLETADRLLPPWPVVHDLGWRIHAFRAIDTGDPAHWRAAVDSAAQAVREDPSSSTAWVRLADLHLRRGNVDAAAEAYEAALARHPWSLPALNGAIHMADRRRDEETVATLCERRAQVVDPADAADCLDDVRRTYAD